MRAQEYERDINKRIINYPEVIEARKKEILTMSDKDFKIEYQKAIDYNNALEAYWDGMERQVNQGW